MHVAARRRKLQDFMVLCTPTPEDQVLDVGVLGEEAYEAANFFVREYQHSENLTVLSIEDCLELRRKYPLVRFVTYDGRAFPLADNSFDICHSNAVVEHVGAHERQRLFVSEMVRVARRGFFTTPNRWFPVELHTKIPLLHYLPWSLFLRLCRVVHRQENIRGVRLLGRHQVDVLMAGTGVSHYRILDNRLLGLTVTFSVFWRK